MLSYASQRCILEHFEANKRIHLSHRCSSIQKVEKSIPLKLHTLSLLGYSLTMNNVVYQIRNVHNKYHLEIIPPQGKSTVRYLPNNSNFLQASETLFNYYLGGRGKIYVGNLDLDGFICPMIEKLDIQASNVNFEEEFREELWKIINVSSYPLKSLIICSQDFISHNLNYRFRDAQKLILREVVGSRMLPTLRGLRNSIIELYDPNISTRDIIMLVREWKENKRAIGSKCLMNDCEDLNLDHFEQNVVAAAVKAMSGRLLDKSELGEGLPPTTIALAIPVSTGESEILLYGYTRGQRGLLSMQMMSVPTGSYRLDQF